MIGYVLISIHILIVILSFFLMKGKVLKIDSVMMVIIVCIPFWGFVSALMISYLAVSGRIGESNQDLENMKSNVDEAQALTVEAPEGENVVPLEDALIMDDSSVRRSVMLDVLMNDTEDFLPVINAARMNDDVEVVHYATTAMIEISKEYELKLQEYSTEYKENPMKEGLLEEYISFLEHYVKSNMVQGQLLEIQRNTLIELLKEKVNRNPGPEDYMVLVETLLDGKRFSDADMALSEMEEKWSDDERAFKLRLRYYYETGAGNKISDMVKKVKSGENYYSREIRELTGIWDEEKLQAGNFRGEQRS